MKKLFFSFFLLWIAIINAAAVDVTVSMNNLSRTMTLAEKGSGIPVDVGTPNTYTYTFSANPGVYVLSAFQSDGKPNGTIELTITDEAQQSFQFYTITTGASNSGWVMHQDYTVDIQVVSREGTKREIVTGESSTANRITFLVYRGDTYYLTLTPNAAHAAEGYLPYEGSATITNNTSPAPAIPMGYTLSISVPSDADLFVGKKFAHYQSYQAIPVTGQNASGSNTVYSYTIGANQQVVYRVSQAGKLTYSSYLSAMPSANHEIVITADKLEGDPAKIDHDVNSNAKYNVADIYMNINEKGYIKLSQNETYQLINLRNWSPIESISNVFWAEPDYHYTIVNENGVADNSVITIDEKGMISPVGNGMAIVLVTYDAITVPSAMGGTFWGAIWPENTGVFVVSIGNSNSGIISNMEVNKGLNITDETGTMAKMALDAVDAELDVFYYLEETGGFDYTFKPLGANEVTLAQPTVGTNSLSYTGFSNSGVTKNEDGSYTVKLKEGRNIVKLSSSTGSEYQVLTAKAISYIISNATNPGQPIQPGDKVSVRFQTLYHPCNKLAGIYNMSAFIQYDGTPNGTSTVGGSNQYTFASSEAAQTFSITIPADWDVTQPVELTKGALKARGFGDPYGAHRLLSLEFGRNPNFSAVQRTAYFGALPDISIPVQETALHNVLFAGVPAEANIVVYNDKKQPLTANADGSYTESYGIYTYEISATGYKMLRESFSISTESPSTITINIEMVEVGDAGWDGETVAEPAIVSIEESNAQGGEFEGMAGFYKISSGYELAWVADQVNNKSNYSVNAVLTNTIDLCEFQWYPVGKAGNSNSLSYKGIFDGGNHTVEGLYIDQMASFWGLFGCIQDATIRNLSVKGDIKITGSSINYVAGIVGYSAGACVIENCHNYVDITAGARAGGVLGYAAASISITNCSNNGNITGSTNLGGIAGYITNGTGALSNLSNNGTITGTSSYIGGIFGNAGSAQSIINSYNTGAMKGTTNVGGISGGLNAQGTISNSYNTGEITVTNSTGIAGAIRGVKTGNVTNVYVNDEKYTDGATYKEDEAFASGEVAWLLGTAFGQTIGTDLLPQLEGETVYQVSYTNNLDSETATIYTNGILPDVQKEGYYAAWYTEPNGEKIEEVSANSNLHVLFYQVPVTGVKLNVNTLELHVNDTFTLLATIEPADSNNKEVTWSSSNGNIVAVDEDGKVTAKALGNAIIKVTTADGGFTATCTIKVVPDPIDVTAVTLNIEEGELYIGKTLQLIATLEPETATFKNVTWSTSNKNIVSVSTTGLVTGRALGEATITVKTFDGGFIATCVIKVVAEPILVKKISLNLEEAELFVNENLQLVATIEPENASNKNVNWTSSDNTVATVDENGSVSGIKDGTATISVTTIDGEFAASCLINVKTITGIDSPTAVFANVYPNPVVEELIIDSPKEPFIQVVISDINGSIIYRNDSPDTNQLVISVGNWSKGTYLVKIVSKEQVSTHKVIKK